MSDKPRYRYSWKSGRWTTPNGVIVDKSYTPAMFEASISADGDVARIRESHLPRLQKGLAVASVLTGHAMMVSGQRIKDALARVQCATITPNRESE